MNNDHEARREVEELETSEQYRKTRSYSLREGVASSVAAGAGESYIVPFALELKANNFAISLFSSLGSLVGPLAQIVGSKLIERLDRKRLVFLTVLAQSLAWLLFVVLGLSSWLMGEVSFSVHILIACYLIYVMAGSLGGPAWFSMIGEAVPEDIRGSYFARRNKITGMVNIASNLLAGGLLFYTRQWHYILLGFIVIFFISFVGRFSSALYFRRHYVAPIKFEKEYYFSIIQFFRQAPFNNFGRFTIFVALINLAMNVAGPFYAIYLWRDLQLNPLWFTLVSISAGLFTALFMSRWGTFADKYGNRELLRIGSLLIIPAPLLWLVSTEPLFLIFVPQLLLGLGWSAFSLAASNFIYDAVTPARRALCVAYYNMAAGIGVALGAAIGGLLSQFIHLNNFNIFYVLFILSALLRLGVHFGLIGSVREVRPEIGGQAEKNILGYFREIVPVYGIFREKVLPLFSFRVKREKDK